MKISSREPTPGNPRRFCGNCSSAVTCLGPAELSTQSPRAVKILSSQRGVMAGGAAPGGGGGGSGRYTGAPPDRFSGLITQYSTSCPAGPVTRNQPCMAGTTYSLPASTRFRSPVSSRGNNNSYLPDVLRFITYKYPSKFVEKRKRIRSFTEKISDGSTGRQTLCSARSTVNVMRLGSRVGDFVCGWAGNATSTADIASTTNAGCIIY